jgi:hypothetical protein
VRSLRTTLISYSRQPNLQGCFANQSKTNDLTKRCQLAALRFPMHVYEIRPRKDKRGFDLISDALPFGRLWYGEPDAIANAIDCAMQATLTSLSSYRPFGAGLYPACFASCSVTYLPFLVVP